MNKIKKIAIASGKGGVGKSMLASSLSMLFSQKKKIIAVDADVDAPNLHLWLGLDEKWDKVERISTNQKPIIDYQKCHRCGQCVSACAFSAIEMIKGKPVVNPYFCEGCGVCAFVCPQRAIQLKPVDNAEIRIKNDVFGFPLVSAQLYPGQTGSGKIVDQMQLKAEEFDYQLMILDVAAGTGCPVIASLRDADFAVLVSEPTPSAFADLKRILKVVDYFQIPYALVINKWNINKNFSDKIEKIFSDKILGKISYDQRIFQAIANLKPIMKTNLPVKREIKIIFNQLLKRI